MGWENENSSSIQEKFLTSYWLFEYLLILIPLITILGNMLVISSITSDALLRTAPSNWFIISLAIADIGGILQCKLPLLRCKIAIFN